MYFKVDKQKSKLYIICYLILDFIILTIFNVFVIYFLFLLLLLLCIHSYLLVFKYTTYQLITINGKIDKKVNRKIGRKIGKKIIRK